MQHRFFVGVVCGLFLIGFGNHALADPPQGSSTSGSEVSFLVAGLGSWQQGTDHGVYVTPGFGGLGVGAVAGVQAARANGFVFAVEGSVTSIQKTQYGRLVTLSDSGASTSATEIQLSALVGQRVRLGRNSIQFLGGVGLTGVSVQGVSSTGGSQPSRPFALVAGFDAAQRLSERVDLVETARVSVISRSREYTDMGVGSSTFRFGVGVRIH